MILSLTSLLCFLLTETAFAVQTSSSGLKPLEEAFNEVARPRGPTLPYIMERAGITHPEQALSLDHAIRAVRIASISNDDLGFLFQSPKFKEFIQDKNDAVALYDYITEQYRMSYMKPSFLNDLKAFAYNRGFPHHFNSISEIMAYRKAEQVEFLVKSPAFVKFTDDLNSLQNLLRAIRKDRNRGVAVWDKHMEPLRAKLNVLWTDAALKNARVSENAQFREHLKDWRNAQTLWLNLKESKAPMKTIAVVERFARNGFQNHLRGVKSVKEVERIIELFHDRDTLEMLQRSTQYQNIIQDPFKAFQLNNMLNSNNRVTKDQAPSFFENLQFAVNRKYRTNDQVQATLANIEVYGENTFYFFKRFGPYLEYISDPGRSRNVLIAIEKDPSSYSTFLKEKNSFEDLKAAAYKNWFPKPDATAEEIAQSYKKLLSVGANEKFQYDNNYLAFLRKGTLYEIELLEEMKIIGIPSDDPLFKQLERRTIRGCLLDVVNNKYGEVVKAFLLSKERVKSVYEFASEKIFKSSFLTELQLHNPNFARELEAAVTASSSH